MLHVRVRKRRGDFSLDVDFAAPTPGVIALFGRSGCGKSTLVNTIAGLVDPDDARIVFDDVTLTDTGERRSLRADKRGIGYVFQDARLFPHLSVLNNLCYGLKRTPRPPNIGLKETVALLGLDKLLSRQPYQLSGGERQRVGLGRALLSQPQLLLLDEPLASLDVARREEVLPYLERLRDRLAIPMVFVSHQFDEVLRLATHVVVMDNGRIAAQGDIGTVSLDPALRAIVGADAVGAVLDGRVTAFDPTNSLSKVTIGDGFVHVHAHSQIGACVRVQMLARDIILATQVPQHSSVRNALAGTVARIEKDDDHADLVHVDIGNALVMARITRIATEALHLAIGTRVWVLVKAVSLRGHAFST